MATLQTLPPLARSYRADQLTAIDETLTEVLARWRYVGTRFDTGWSLVGPAIAAIVGDAQTSIAQRADAYVPAILEDTGQTRHLAAAAASDVSQFAGLTGDGFPVYESLSRATIRAKQAVSGGQTPRQALAAAADWLSMATTTILADTARGAESLGRYTRNVGYVRMVNGGACGRCVVQAGKWFRTNQGFLRHPRCRCVHIPATEDVAGSWQTSPDEYFRSLNFDQQVKLMGGKANAQAVIDGADIGQLVNAYRRSSGMRFAQESPIKRRGLDKYTSEGTTRRAQAAQQQMALRRNGRLQQRLMPETVARVATDADDRMRLLRLYGWVRDDEAIGRGRTIFAEQRRTERAARAVARRAEAKAASPNPETVTGGAGANPPRPPAPGSAAFAPDPEPSDKAAWKARQDAIGVDFKGETLHPHEVRFVERFVAAGHRLEWISTAGHKPTNDFVWQNNDQLLIELKSTKAKFSTIRGRILETVVKAERQGVVKANFIIDLADQELSDELRTQIASYNVGRRQYRIRRLWVMSQGQLEEIPLAMK